MCTLNSVAVTKILVALKGYFEFQVQNPEKKKGFHEYERKAMPYRDHKDRVLDWEEVYAHQTKKSPHAALDDNLAILGLGKSPDIWWVNSGFFFLNIFLCLIIYIL